MKTPSMKFFSHEGTEYVTVFSADRDPVIISVDKVLSWCLLHGTQFGVTLFYSETIFGEITNKERLFPYSTPNLAQAILEELGPQGILDRVNHPSIYQRSKIANQ